MITPLPAHRSGPLFAADDARVFLLTFRDGDVFRLRAFSIVDPSIYGIADRWTATIVEPVSGARSDFKRLFVASSGIDFEEADIVKIVADDSGEVLFRERGTVAGDPRERPHVA